MLKMYPSTALLLGPVSNRCWNSQLLEAVLEWRGLGLLPSNSLPPLVTTVAWWEGLQRWPGAGHLLSSVMNDGI